MTRHHQSDRNTALETATAPVRPSAGSRQYGTICILIPGSRDQLLPAVDREGHSCQRRVAHDVNGERGDVTRLHDASDWERRAADPGAVRGHRPAVMPRAVCR